MSVNPGRLPGSAAAIGAALALAATSGATTPSTAVTVTAIASGRAHTCALTSAGALKCWGDNTFGQLGDGTTTNSTFPVTVNGLGSSVAAVAAGGYEGGGVISQGFTCALTTAGGVKCWGSNESGELGDGSSTNSAVPVDVSGLSSGIVAIAAGGAHDCAVTSSGLVKCWGQNGFGQLGDGTTSSRFRPVDVPGLNSVVALTAGAAFTCALISDGSVKCWGDNDHGQLGDGTTTEQLAPVSVSGLTGPATAISAGGYHTCARLSSGGVECWGWNTYGQVGDGTQTDRLTPTGVSGLTTGVRAVAGGYWHTCALTDGGGVKCWGRNSSGQLGDFTAIDRSTPVDAFGLASGGHAVAGGWYHTCAAMTTGGAKCWGRNSEGQLGDLSTTDREVPGEVAFETCVVPKLVGKLLARAKKLIVGAHCRVGHVTKKRSTTRRKGRVLAQKPKPGEKVIAATRVDLVVGKGLHSGRK